MSFVVKSIEPTVSRCIFGSNAGSTVGERLRNIVETTDRLQYLVKPLMQQ